MEALQYGTVVTADFSENTITFEMDECFTIKAGEFAIVKLNSLQDKIALEEFIESLKK